MGRERDELEDALDVVLPEAGLEQALGGASAHEALGAGARVDAGRLHAHDAARPLWRSGGDADQRHHLLRRQPGDRRLAADGPQGADRHLGAQGRLPLDDAAGDVLGEKLDEQRLLETTASIASSKSSGKRDMWTPFWSAARSTVQSIVAAITVSDSLPAMRTAFETPVTPARVSPSRTSGADAWRSSASPISVLSLTRTR